MLYLKILLNQYSLWMYIFKYTKLKNKHPLTEGINNKIRCMSVMCVKFSYNKNLLLQNIGVSGSGISCCRDGQVLPNQLRHPDCFAIDLPRNDHIFSPFGERCMEFVRSLPAPRPECNFGPREQVSLTVLVIIIIIT